MSIAEIALALAIATLSGAVFVKLLWTPIGPGASAGALGYGYLLGVVLSALLMGLQPLLGLPLDPGAALAGLLLAAALVLALARLRLRGRAWRLRAKGPGHGLRAASGARLLVLGLLLLVAGRTLDLLLEAWWRPVLAWDAWTTWMLRAKVWTELEQRVPFVSPADWLEGGPPLGQALAAWHYPETVSLIAAWASLAAGEWLEPVAALPWVGCFLALGLGFYAQARVLGAPWTTAIVFVYLLLSLPLLNTQVALAGYADLWLATALGFAFMSFVQWVRTGDRNQGVLALLMAAIAALLKVEGTAWLLAFVPAVLVSARRYRLLALLVAAGAAVIAAGSVLPSPVGIELPGQAVFAVGGGRLVMPYLGSLSLGYSGSAGALFKHLFLYGNWHLFAYLVTGGILWSLFRWVTRRSARWEQAALAWVLAALGAYLLVFLWTDAAQWALEGTSVNRVFLQLVPALLFWLLALWVTARAKDEPTQAARRTDPAAATATRLRRRAPRRTKGQRSRVRRRSSRRRLRGA